MAFNTYQKKNYGAGLQQYVHQGLVLEADCRDEKTCGFHISSKLGT